MSYAPASGSLADPAGSGVVLGALQWLQGTLLGTAATSVAVICMAAVGLMMLSGRIDLRRAMSVILGCFILFGAPGIAAGILAAAGSADIGAAAGPPPATPPPPPAELPLPAPPPPGAEPDPFAGAAVPDR